MEKKPTPMVMITAVTVNASRNADSTAATDENNSDRMSLDRTFTRILVNRYSSMSFMK